MALCRHKAHRPVAEATDGDIHDVGTPYELREQEVAIAAAAGARYWCRCAGGKAPTLAPSTRLPASNARAAAAR
jgi:hypothetical protein